MENWISRYLLLGLNHRESGFPQKMSHFIDWFLKRISESLTFFIWLISSTLNGITQAVVLWFHENALIIILFGAQFL